MNQKILIVFTLFLLISILLLLLMADAKEKSRRIRVLVMVSGDSVDAEQMEGIKVFLEEMRVRSQLIFTLAGENGEWNERPSAVYPVVLQIQTDAVTDKKNEIVLNANDRNTLWLIVRSFASLYNDPDFSSQVLDAIVQIATKH